MVDDENNSPTEFDQPTYYRPCVGAVLFNDQGLVWVGKRIAEPRSDLEYAWQMPQGGIDTGETPDIAVKRELLEETGANHSEILRESENWLHYDVPPHLFRKTGKGGFRGQTQKWFALRFLGNDSEFQLDIHEKPEFSAWKWVNLEEVPELIVPFKRDVYIKVVEEFRDLPERIANE